MSLDATDGYGRTPLAICIKNGQRDTSLLLLKEAVDVNAADAHGVTPLVLSLVYSLCRLLLMCVWFFIAFGVQGGRSLALVAYSRPRC